MGYVPDEVVAALRGSTNLGIFFRLDSDPSLHLWFGVNDVPIGIPSLDPEGTIYTGGGRFGELPPLEILLNGQADRVEFSMSSAAPEFSSVLFQLEEEDPVVKGREVHVGLTTLDERWQPMSQIIPLWHGLADYWASRQTPGRPSPTRSLILSVGSGDTARSRPRRGAWTDTQHKQDHPTDSFMDRVSRYTRQYVVTWPRF